MFCRNCGTQIQPGNNVCTNCGVPAGLGNHFCPNCAGQTHELAVVCVRCNCPLNAVPPMPAVQQKSKLVAGLLAIFIGTLGIHNFYLGYNQKAIIQLLIATVGGIFTCGLSSIVVAIWALIEAVQIFTGSIAVDSNGVPLKD